MGFNPGHDRGDKLVHEPDGAWLMGFVNSGRCLVADLRAAHGRLVDAADWRERALRARLSSGLATGVWLRNKPQRVGQWVDGVQDVVISPGTRPTDRSGR